jgi:hypothetical protein
MEPRGNLAGAIGRSEGGWGVGASARFVRLSLSHVYVCIESLTIGLLILWHRSGEIRPALSTCVRGCEVHSIMAVIRMRMPVT